MAGPAFWAERSEACRNLTKNYQEILIRPDFSEWRQNWTSEIEEVLRYKTAQKAVKSEQKKLVDIRTYEYVIKKQKQKRATNGTTVKNKRNRVKCAFTREIRIFYYHRPAETTVKKVKCAFT